MSFPVINSFIEKEHDGITYNVGERYPKEGYKASDNRVTYLQSDDNPYKVAFLGPEIKSETVEEDDHEDVKKSNPKKKSSTKK
jgi:hypothetical protein